MHQNAKERAAARLRARQERAERMAEQDRINAEAEAAGAGGVKITDERQPERILLGKSKRVAEPAANKRASEPAENKLAGVSFASPAARTAAEEAGLTAEAFSRKKKSSERGFTAADVEGIAANTQDDEA